MTPEETKHRECSPLRAQAYGDLFGDKPVAVHPASLLERMEEVGLPWIFEETNRPSLVD